MRGRGWSTFIAMRLLELVIHVDDLAVSVGLPTPPLPEAAQEIVATLLMQVSAARHGWLPILRTLARSERAPTEGISAFQA